MLDRRYEYSTGVEEVVVCMLDQLRMQLELLFSSDGVSNEEYDAIVRQFLDTLRGELYEESIRIADGDASLLEEVSNELAKVFIDVRRCLDRQGTGAHSYILEFNR